MAQLQGTMEDLRRSKLDLPPKAKQNESPAMPFGLFTEPKEASVSTRGKGEEKEVSGEGEEKCGGREKGKGSEGEGEEKEVSGEGEEKCLGEGERKGF